MEGLMFAIGAESVQFWGGKKRKSLEFNNFRFNLVSKMRTLYCFWVI